MVISIPGTGKPVANGKGLSLDSGILLPLGRQQCSQDVGATVASLNRERERVTR